MTELLRRHVVTLLVDQKLLARRFARNMLSWRHSGFSVAIQFGSSIEACSDLWLNTSRVLRSR